MPIPSNITRNTATDLGTLPASVTQDVNFTGTTYEVWYKVTPPSDGVISIFGFGDLAAYFPNTAIYENADVAEYLDFQALATAENVPVYIPVTGGNEYFMAFGPVPPANVTPAVLTLTVSYAQSNTMQAGDFITNREVDGDMEYPLTVLNGSTSNTVRKFVQMSAPVTVRGQLGLPHGSYGAIFSDGNFAFADEQYPNVKIYDKDMALVSTITLADVAITVGFGRVLDRMYTIHDAGATNDVTSFDSTGTQVDTWATSIGSCRCLGVNSDETILYYNPGGTTTIKRWDLTLNIAMADLVADTVGFEMQDLLVLEDDTILACHHDESGTPRDVNVLHYSAAGATLNTYAFGIHWRSEFNPPRIGFSLDSPTTFWVVLKPQPGEFAGQGFQTSIFREITVSSGAQVGTDLIQTNYLPGVYIGDPTATPESLFGSEKSYPILVATVAAIVVPPLNGPAALAAFEADGTMRDYRIVWSRRAPHMADEGQRVFYSKFQLDLEAGVGTVSGQGVTPTCELRWSNDGGFTWSGWRQLSMGPLGQYKFRAIARQLGQARDRVFEVRGSDPVKVALLQAYLEVQEGSN